ncbi:hypothetical protein L1987_77798 [Smallanthus sonchifolius]|uniref:Uncharacterized protein n=1 Tax=Smallanthus sonchifolius TaxID=185202 RepID=A0ACB8ZAJ9_9ASTR|nr:hypothetical protein L1987_77798 [Smallanthus sonchifolius]
MKGSDQTTGRDSSKRKRKSASKELTREDIVEQQRYTMDVAAKNLGDLRKCKGFDISKSNTNDASSVSSSASVFSSARHVPIQQLTVKAKHPDGDKVLLASEKDLVVYIDNLKADDACDTISTITTSLAREELRARTLEGSDKCSFVEIPRK